MRKRKQVHTPNVALAIQSADAFLKLSKSFLDSVGTDMQSSHQRAVRDLGGMIASATNLSLAVELYLKSLRLLQSLDPTTDHDLWALFQGLPEWLKDSVAREYQKNNKGVPTGVAVSFELAMAPRVPGEAEVQELNRQRPANDNSLDAVLKRSRNAFQTWRYLHEKGDSQRIVMFRYDFHFLGCAAMALRTIAIDLLARQSQTGASSSQLPMSQV